MDENKTGLPMIPLAVPEIRGNEWQYIRECLDTSYVSSVGAFVDRFERAMATYTGAKHAVAVVNGTAALHVALLVAGIRPYDEVLVPALTFIAPANAVRYIGAWPVFVDVDPLYWQMDVSKVVDFLERACRWEQGELRNRATGRRVAAILPVHLLGHPVDMDPILETARKCGLAVIEDAAESLGAKYRGRMVGHLGDIACFSFNGNKVITTGGGGMVVTDNEAWARRARYLTTQAKDDPVEYIHGEIGYNYRLTNIQAAMGVAQMELLGEYLGAKKRIAGFYRERLSDVPGLSLPGAAGWAEPTYWLYSVLVDAGAYGMNSRNLMRRLQGAHIQSRPLWHPLHRLKPFKECMAYQIEVADRLYRDGLSLPSSVGLGRKDQERVCRDISRW